MSTSELRKRTKSPQENDGHPTESKNREPVKKSNRGLLLFTVTVTILLTLIITAGNLLQSASEKHAQTSVQPRIFTPEQLSKFTGQWRGRILIGCMGRVYDVTPGRRHYGPGAGYGHFAGRDASRSFVTGGFTTDLHDDVENFTAEEFASLMHWREFYENSKEYKFVGMVIGRFYNENGEETALLRRAKNLSAEHRAREEAQEIAEAILCNVSWKKESGGWVHCGDEMKPRKVGVPDGEGNMQERCLCLNGDEVTEGRRLYEGCEPSSSRCQASKPGEN